MNESCHIYEWVISHAWMSHVIHMNESCHTYEWVMSHIWMSHVAHMNESCRTYEWVTSHMSTSNVTLMSHITHIWMSCCTCQWVISHIWLSHVTHMNESCHVCQRVTLYIWMSHVTRTGWRRLIGTPKLQMIFHKRATKHRSLLRKMIYKDKGSMSLRHSVCMNLLAHMSESCHTFEWTISHKSMIPGPRRMLHRGATFESCLCVCACVWTWVCDCVRVCEYQWYSPILLLGGEDS